MKFNIVFAVVMILAGCTSGDCPDFTPPDGVYAINFSDGRGLDDSYPSFATSGITGQTMAVDLDAGSIEISYYHANSTEITREFWKVTK